LVKPSWMTHDAAFKRARAAGYRSGLEESEGKRFAAAGVEAEYEPFRIPYVKPAKDHHYTPDWVLPNGIIVETKGMFTTEDRTKHRLIREQYPDLDIRFVFSNPNSRIGKKSKTSYADWCDRLGVKWAAKTTPQEWIKEAPEATRMAAMRQFRDPKPPKRTRR
jgi:hypothetical protein